MITEDVWGGLPLSIHYTMRSGVRPARHLHLEAMADTYARGPQDGEVRLMILAPHIRVQERNTFRF